MDEKLIRMYMKYKKSLTDKAVSFVSQTLRYAKLYWIEILSCRYVKKDDYLYTFYDFSKNNTLYKTVTCNLYKRTITPEYPEKNNSENDEKNKILCNAITWDTAKKDIEKQKKEGIKCNYWKIELRSPESYLYKKAYNLSKYIDWEKVPKELKLKLAEKNRDTRMRAYGDIIKEYAKSQDIFKNNTVSYVLYCNKKMIFS